MFKKKSRNEKIIDMYKAGSSLRKVGKKFGVTHQRVSQILNFNEVETRMNLPNLYTCRACSIHFTRLDNPKSTILCNKCQDHIWCKKLGLFACNGCGRSEEKHYREGYCSKCYYARTEVKKYNSERHVEYYSNNKEKITAKTKEWQEKNKEKVLLYVKSWQSRNKEHVKDLNRKKYAKNRIAWIMYYYLRTLIPEEAEKIREKEKIRTEKNKIPLLMYNHLLKIMPEEIEKRKRNYENKKHARKILSN